MKHAITVKKGKGGDLRRDCGVVAPVSKSLHSPAGRLDSPAGRLDSPASRFEGRAVRTKESGSLLTTTVY